MTMSFSRQELAMAKKLYRLSQSREWQLLSETHERKVHIGLARQTGERERMVLDCQKSELEAKTQRDQLQNHTHKLQDPQTCPLDLTIPHPLPCHSTPHIVTRQVAFLEAQIDQQCSVVGMEWDPDVQITLNHICSDVEVNIFFVLR
jgi:chromatin segregation and condensation protein Rec8/ScpA/Scc1 (kleisin family)